MAGAEAVRTVVAAATVVIADTSDNSPRLLGGAMLFV